MKNYLNHWNYLDVYNHFMFLVDFLFLNDVIMISCVILNLGIRRGHRKTPFGMLEDCIRIKILWAGPSSLSLGSSYQTGGKHQNIHKKNILFVKMLTFLIYPPRERSHLPTKRDNEKSSTPRFRPVRGHVSFQEGTPPSDKLTWDTFSRCFATFRQDQAESMKRKFSETSAWSNAPEHTWTPNTPWVKNYTICWAFIEDLPTHVISHNSKTKLNAKDLVKNSLLWEIGIYLYKYFPSIQASKQKKHF